MTPKDIYEKKKRYAAERKLRNEEAAMEMGNRDVEGDILLAGAVVAMERIADALEKFST